MCEEKRKKLLATATENVSTVLLERGKDEKAVAVPTWRAVRCDKEKEKKTRGNVAESNVCGERLRTSVDSGMGLSQLGFFKPSFLSWFFFPPCVHSPGESLNDELLL